MQVLKATPRGGGGKFSNPEPTQPEPTWGQQPTRGRHTWGPGGYLAIPTLPLTTQGTPHSRGGTRRCGQRGRNGSGQPGALSSQAMPHPPWASWPDHAHSLIPAADAEAGYPRGIPPAPPTDLRVPAHPHRTQQEQPGSQSGPISHGQKSLSQQTTPKTQCPGTAGRG